MIPTKAVKVKLNMFQNYINFQLDRVKSCPQSSMLGQSVFEKFEGVLTNLTAHITKSTQTKIIAQILSDNPFAEVPELLTEEEKNQAIQTAKQQIENGELILPELLVKTLTRQLESVTDGFLEMVSRMFDEENRNAICKALTDGKLYHSINDITLEDGDTHNNGRRVIIIHTDAGKLVYKPHDLRGDEQIYYLAKNFFDEFIGIPKSIAFDDKFGVCEFIEKQCAQGNDEAERFYYSLGGLALFAKVFGSTDLHHTNILAHGTKPYIIDLETVFYPVSLERESSDRKYMRHSVFNSLIMPSNHKDYEFSILMDVKEDGNAPVVDGKKVSVRNYIETFKNGYHDAYTQALAHREEIAKIVRDFPPQMPIRYIHRATRVYGQLLNRLYHSSVFEDEQSMKQNIDILSELLHKNKKDIDEKVIASEIKQLRRGDVPYFYTYTDSLNVYGDGEELITKKFDITAVDSILETLEAMGERDELFDLACIDNAIRRYPEKLFEREEGLEKLKHENIKLKPERKGVPLPVNIAFDEAKRILDEVYDLKIPAPDGKFLWGYMSSSSSSVLLSDFTLYDGFSGMAIFASALASVSDDNHVNKIAAYLVNAAIDEIKSFLKRLKSPDNPPDFAAPIGEAAGLDGVLKALALIKIYLPDEKEKINNLCDEIFEILENTDFAKYTKADIITGLAGVISTLCRFEEYRAHKNIVRLAADRLLELKDFKYHDYVLWKTLPETPRVISGGGHGMAGIAQALFAAAELLGDGKYISAADEALDYEIKNYEKYSPKFQTWADMRDFPPRSYMHGYCYGAPGIGIMLNRIGKAGGEKCEILKGYARSSVDNLPLNMCDHLCCANSAIVEYYLTTGDYNSAGEILAAMYERKQNEGNYRFHSYTKNNAVTASLFYGLCGIGYEMLRYSFPEKILSIL